jgi:hypothetical protein
MISTAYMSPDRLLHSPDKGSKTLHTIVIVLGILNLPVYILRFVKNNRLAGQKDLLKGLKTLYK